MVQSSARLGSLPNASLPHLLPRNLSVELSSGDNMFKKKEDLTQEQVRKLFDYDPATGVLKWKVSLHPRIKIGRLIKNPGRDGYLEVGVYKKNYFAHRIIWLWVYGVWPDEIDHINGRRADNRLINLRDVSHSENHKNLSLRYNNTSGHIGVYWNGYQWRAFLNIDGKQVVVGGFKNINDAIQARVEAGIKNGYHQNHGRKGYYAQIDAL